MPATYFQHPFAGEIDLGRVAMLKLNEVPVGLVGRLQREGHRRIFLAAQLGNTDRSADRPPEGITFYRALDSDEEAELPLRTGVTRFLRKPDV